MAELFHQLQYPTANRSSVVGRDEGRSTFLDLPFVPSPGPGSVTARLASPAMARWVTGALAPVKGAIGDPLPVTL